MVRFPLHIAQSALCTVIAFLSCCDPSQCRADDIKVIRSVEYATYDERDAKGNLTGKQRKLLSDIYLPSKEPFANEHGEQPTVLMVHGGAWFSGNKAHVTLHARDVAASGYAVVAINYRLAPRYKFPAQLEDMRSALRFIQSNAEKYEFDTGRIAAYGYSAGAHLVSLLAVTQNEKEGNMVDGARVRAIVAGGTPCEFSWIPEKSERLAFWLGDSRERNPLAYTNASPTSFVNQGDPPLFLFHGTKDRIVPIESSRRMKRLLEEKHVPHQLHVVKNADHLGAFIDPKSRATAIGFLKTYLVGESSKANPKGSSAKRPPNAE